MRRSTWLRREVQAILASVILLGGAGESSGTLFRSGPLELSGNLQSQQLIRHPKITKYQFIQQRNVVHLRADWEWLDEGRFLDRFDIPFVEKSHLFILYRGVYDSVYDYLPGMRVRNDLRGRLVDPRHNDLDDLSRHERDALKFENSLREAYVDIFLKDLPLSFRLGKQQIIWGESDGFRMLDRANNLDLTWHFQQELPPPAFGFDELRIPYWMVKGLWEFGNVGRLTNAFVEAYWNPGDWQPAKIAFLPRPWGVKIMDPLTNHFDGAFFLPFEADRLMNNTVLFRRGDYARNPLENSQFGIRFSAVSAERMWRVVPEGLQFTVGYLYQRFGADGTAAAMARGLPETPENEIKHTELVVDRILPVEFFAPYIHTIGLAANYAEDNYTRAVYRFETAYDFGIPFYTRARRTTYSPFLPFIYDSDMWKALIAFDRPTWIRALNRRSTFFITGQWFVHYLIHRKDNIVGGLDLPSALRGLDISLRDDVHRWEMLLTFGIIGFYRGGSVVPSSIYILDPVNSYSQEFVWGVDYFVTPDFAVNLSQRFLINPTKKVNFEPWGLGGLNEGRSELGLRLTYQF